MASHQLVPAQTADKRLKVVGSADYPVFQTLFDVETTRRRTTPQPSRQAISKLELRDDLVKRRNTPFGSVSLAAGHILVLRYNSNGSGLGIGVSLGNNSGQRKVMAMAGQDLWKVSGARAGSFEGGRFYLFLSFKISWLQYQSYFCL